MNALKMTQGFRLRGDAKILYASDSNNIAWCILRSSPHRRLDTETPEAGDVIAAGDRRRHLDRLAGFLAKRGLLQSAAIGHRVLASV